MRTSALAGAALALSLAGSSACSERLGPGLVGGAAGDAVSEDEATSGDVDARGLDEDAARDQEPDSGRDARDVAEDASDDSRADEGGAGAEPGPDTPAPSPDPDPADTADPLPADTADPDPADTADSDPADTADSDPADTADSDPADGPDPDLGEVAEVTALPPVAVAPPYCSVQPCAFDTAFDTFSGLTGDVLRRALLAAIDGHVALSYEQARDRMYATDTGLDVHDGLVECLYTGEAVAADGTRTPGGVFNTEHVWPRSRGAGAPPAISDLHHIRPTLEAANTARDSYSFGLTDCDAGLHCAWSGGGSELGASAHSGAEVFEVRSTRRGDVARAMFYVALRYTLALGPEEEAVLRLWNVEDPPSDDERERHERVAGIQANRNPFIDRPDFVDAIPDF